MSESLSRRLDRLEAHKGGNVSVPRSVGEAFKQALDAYVGLSGTPEEEEALRQSVPVFEAVLAAGRSPEEAWEEALRVFHDTDYRLRTGREPPDFSEWDEPGYMSEPLRKAAQAYRPDGRRW